VPEAYARLTLVLEYNDAEGLREVLRRRGEEIAAIIFEPVVGNAGVLVPTEDFLKALHEAREFGVLLIADEVMTGFRLAFGGATELFGLKPDLVTLGKVLGGGLPAAAYGGRREVMERVTPLGPVYQAGTLSGNPLAMASGLATLEILEADPGLYAHLEAVGARLEAGLREVLDREGRAPHHQPGGVHADRLLHRRPRAHLRRGQAHRYRALQALLPRPSCPGRVLAALQL
jgi:glutamate-1-semialdehyde 2,1-aminomutase